MDYKKEQVKGWNVYTVDGELTMLQSDDYDRLSHDVRDAIRSGEFKFFFDLTKSPYIDSSGLSILILVVSTASKNSVTVKVCGLNDITKKVFNLLRAHHIFEFFNSREDGLKTL